MILYIKKFYFIIIIKSETFYCRVYIYRERIIFVKKELKRFAMLFNFNILNYKYCTLYIYICIILVEVINLYSY